MMGNTELAPEVDVSILEPLLSPDVVSELLNTYMSTLTVSRAGRASEPDRVGARSRSDCGRRADRGGGATCSVLASEGGVGSVSGTLDLPVRVAQVGEEEAGLPVPGAETECVSHRYRNLLWLEE